MRGAWRVLPLALLLLAGCSVTRGKLWRTDLGHGYAAVIRGKQCDIPQWHGEYPSRDHVIYHGDQRLGVYEWYAISPCGRYALFETPKSKVVLFDGQTRLVEVLHQGYYEWFERVDWHATGAVAIVGIGVLDGRVRERWFYVEPEPPCDGEEGGG